MDKLPEKLQKKLEERERNNSIRSLDSNERLVDFSSNDYLGFSTSEWIFNKAGKLLEHYKLLQNGATGSRLLTGNHQMYTEAETIVASFHKCEAALIFNSGYDANIGLLSSVPQREDVIFYDEYCHASIRDGIKLSQAKAYKFRHNDLDDLEKTADRIVGKSKFDGEVYVVTESVFSMDGDSPDLFAISQLCERMRYRLIVDEAHATGVMGPNGKGSAVELDLEGKMFARIVTFGKALGAHGAAILASPELRTYVINFSRSFIYTTGLPPHTVATIIASYDFLQQKPERIEKLHRIIEILRSNIYKYELQGAFIDNRSAIQSCLLPGNDRVKYVSEELKRKGFNVKPILSPTVPKGQERLRICLHSYNTEEQIERLMRALSELIKSNSPDND